GGAVAGGGGVRGVATREPCDALVRAILPPAVRIGAVEECREALLRHGRRVLERRDQIGELCFTRTPDLVACEGGLSEHLPQEVDAGREVVTQELPAPDAAGG